MTRHELETTSKMPRDELLGLLNTMAAIEHQRITSPFAAISPDVIDEPAVIHGPPPPELKATFVNLRLHRVPVIAISFAVTLALGLTALIVA